MQSPPNPSAETSLVSAKSSSHLFKDYTVQEMIDELDLMECLTVPGKDPICGEFLRRQEALYAAMGVEAPRTGFSL